MRECADLFVHSRNAMCKALLEAGVDPFVTGTVMTNLEEMGFYMLQMDNRLKRLERRVTRQDTRQSAESQQGATVQIFKSSQTLRT